MVIDHLNEKLIDSGKHLLEELDKSNIKTDAALWFYFPDIESWKLLLSFPNIENAGPKAVYQIIQKMLLKIKSEISLDDITVSKPKNPLLKLLKIAIKTGTGISSIRFTNNVINGQLIKDAHIYRLL